MEKNKIVNITLKENKETVYDIETKSHNYILANGIISHNTIGSFFPGKTIAGGCLTDKSFIKTPKTPTGLTNIKDFNVGDVVQTMFGNKKVINTFHYKKPINVIEMEDGTIIEATDEHRFLVETTNGYIWKEVRHLLPEDVLIKVTF